MRYTLRFEEVKLRAKKRGKCGCGKVRVRTMVFKQTLNPWNVTGPKRIPKTREDILKELEKERAWWLKEVPILCDRCGLTFYLAKKRL